MISSPGVQVPSGDPITRARILEAADRLFAQRPAADVRMADIAREADVSRQALYLHFSDRAALLREVLRGLEEQAVLGAELDQVATSSDGRGMVHRFVELHARIWPIVEPLTTELERRRGLDDDADLAWRDRLTIRLAGATAVAMVLRREQLLRPEWTAEEAADLLWGVTDIGPWRNWIQERGWTAEEYTRRISQLVICTLIG